MISASHRLRGLILFLIFVTAYGIILFYLSFIQIFYTTFFTSLAEQQHRIIIEKYPPRAPIYDRNNKLLAYNKETFSAFVIPNHIKHKDSLFAFLAEHYPTSLTYIKAHPHLSFAYIARRLTDKEHALLDNANIADIHFLTETMRFYPFPSLISFLGFTDIDNNGLAGVELLYNHQLAGSPSKLCLEKDARSGYFYFHKELQKKGASSQPIHLTIDSDLQFLVDEEIASAKERYNAEECSALIMDPTSGDILVIASHPYGERGKQVNFEYLKPRAFTESYELGSVIKVAAALAALEEGVVKFDELIDCKNCKSTIIDGRQINTLTAHGIIPFYDVIALSNNIGIAQIAKRLGTKLYEHYVKIGFGQKTGISFPGENAGFINPPEKWSKQSIISLSYGYEIRATLLQLACFFSMIAQNGKKVIPRLILDKAMPVQNSLYHEISVLAIKEILKNTTDHGTTRRSKLFGYNILAKTGTANMIEDGRYRKTNDLLTCAGIVEKENYKRVIVTSIQKPKIPNAYASTLAVPLFKSIAEKMIIHERAF